LEKYDSLLIYCFFMLIH